MRRHLRASTRTVRMRRSCTAGRTDRMRRSRTAGPLESNNDMQHTFQFRQR